MNLTTLRSRLLELDGKAHEKPWYYMHLHADHDLVRTLCSRSTRRVLLAALDVVSTAQDLCETPTRQAEYIVKLREKGKAFERALADVSEEK